MTEDQVRRIADEMYAALRRSRPRSQQELDGQLDVFQAAFHGLQKARGTPAAIAACTPTIDLLQGNARDARLELPGWFLEIVSIVRLQATRDRLKAATLGLASALDDVTRGTRES